MPAPVACSNQKRLPAFGILGRLGELSSPSSSAGASSSQSCGSSGSSSSSSSSSPGMPAEASDAASCALGGRCRSPLPFAADSASSAVSVPESASTWWAESTRAVDELRLVLARAGGRARAAATTARRQASDGTFAPASSSASAASSARRRGVPGGERGRGVLALGQEGLAGERGGAVDLVGWKASVAWIGHWRGLSHERLGQVTVRSGAATNVRRDAPARLAGRSSRRRSSAVPLGRCSRESVSIEADCGADSVRSATLCPMRRVVSCVLGVVVLIAVVVIGLTQAGGSEPRPPPSTAVRPRAARSRSSPARRRRWRRCYAQANQLLERRRARVRRAAGRAQGPPGGDQQVGVVVRAVPARSSRSSSRSPPSAARRSRSSASTPATRTGPAKKFLASARCRSRPTRTRTRRSRASIEAPAELPDHAVRRRDGKTAYIHQGAYTSDAAARPTTSTATCRLSAHRGPRRPAHRAEDDHRRRARGPARAAASTSTRRPPIDPATDPFLPGPRGPDAARGLRACGRRRRPDAPGWTVRVVPNMYPALAAGRRRAARARRATRTCSPPSPPPARTR